MFSGKVNTAFTGIVPSWEKTVEELTVPWVLPVAVAAAPDSDEE